jgi:hypothetical protein
MVDSIRKSRRRIANCVNPQSHELASKLVLNRRKLERKENELKERLDPLKKQEEPKKIQ